MRPLPPTLAAALFLATVLPAAHVPPADRQPLPVGGTPPPPLVVRQIARQLPDGTWETQDWDQAAADAFLANELAPFDKHRAWLTTWLEIAVEHDRWCRSQLPLFTDRPSAAAYAESVRWHNLAWAYLFTAMNTSEDEDTRTEALESLVNLIGEDAAAEGWMPPPWPDWLGWDWTKGEPERMP